jgi:allantoinase
VCDPSVRSTYTAVRCPHYLLMTNAEHVSTYGTLAKINPPIREQPDQDALWQAVESGSVDVIGTDHAPQPDDDKKLHRRHEDMWSALPGFAGVETSIPLMLTQVNKGRLTLERLVELCSTNPARIFGLYPDRGVLRAGAIADITLLDLDEEWTIDRRRLHSKATATPFDGWPVRGKVTHTIVNGQLVYDEGRILGTPGQGRFVRAHGL